MTKGLESGRHRRNFTRTKGVSVGSGGWKTNGVAKETEVSVVCWFDILLRGPSVTLFYSTCLAFQSPTCCVVPITP